MKRKIKNLVKEFVFGFQRVSGGEKRSILMGEMRAEQIRSKKKIANLAEAEFSVFSQWGEDGILSWLVDVVANKDNCFVEFGVEDFREANCRYLLMSRNWSGLIIDGSQGNIDAVKKDAISYKHDLQSVCSFITKENIVSLLADSGYSGKLGLLSVDIDGVDYWVLEQIKNPCDIIVVEYNAMFGNAFVSVPYDPAFVRLEKHWSGTYWGASLAAFRFLLEARDYTYVVTNSVGTNAFFVANEHAQKILSRMDDVKTWPCKMREARLQNGALAYKTYSEMRQEINHLPVVNVRAGNVETVLEALKVETQ
jgi:hypothetical protein